MANVHSDGKGYYRFSKGYSNKDGKRVQKHHSLGTDKKFAQTLATFIEAEWSALPGDDATKVWTDEALNRAKENAKKSAKPTDAQSSPPATNTPSNQVSDPTQPPAKPQYQFAPKATRHAVIRLSDAFEMYAGELQERLAAKDIAEIHARTTAERIQQASKHFHDQPLNLVDNEYLKTIRRSITKRPLKKLQTRVQRYDANNQPIPLPPQAPAESISVPTVKNWLMALGMAFDWFSRKTEPTPANPKAKLWTPDDPNWREQFTVTKAEERKMMDEDERRVANKPDPTFNMEQVKIIYGNLIPVERLYMLCGIWFGWTQSDLAKFRKDELVNDKDEPWKGIEDGEMFVHRNRGKTGVEGHWWVFPELAELLFTFAFHTPNRADKLALLTAEGKPLIVGKSDHVAGKWKRTTKRLKHKIPQYPFKCFRKLGSQLIFNHTMNDTFVQLFESHTPTTVSQQSYVSADRKVGTKESLFQSLHKAQREVYETEMKQLFQPTKPIQHKEVQAA